MAQVKFKRVNALPATLEGGAFYFVEAGDYAESYVTNSTGQAKAIGNSAMINALVTAQLQNLSVNTVEVAADIAARDALIAGATANLLIIVLDATADTSVAAGAALYVYEKDADAVHKIAEY